MDSVKDLITVIVPVYNRESIVDRTLDSIASQSVRPRLIIVDNNSSDGTLPVVKRWASAHVSEEFPIEVSGEVAKGAAAARQKGFGMSATPFVMFFDSDDIMLPGHIERLAKAISDYPDIDIFGWDIAVSELDGSRRIYPFADKDIAFRHIFNGIFSTQRYAVRSKLLTAVGGWNPSVLGWDDYELGVRILCASPKVKYLDGEPTVEMKRLEESITGTDYASSASKWEHAMDICRGTLSRHGNTKWTRWIELKTAVLAGLYGREGDQSNASRLFNQTLDREPSVMRRILLTIAFRYTACGGRGIHHLLRPFL